MVTIPSREPMVRDSAAQTPMANRFLSGAHSVTLRAQLNTPAPTHRE